MTELTISTGRLSGRAGGSGIAAYLGIPYAAPPVGPLRFAPPQPPASWSGVRDATRFGPAAPQAVAVSPRVVADMSAGHESEDCLVLNVWTPGGNGRPVMVFIHGGAFITGAGSVAMYDGEALSARGVVVVTINYRLGLLGWMRAERLGASGNQGLADQAAALEWVQREIASFGGDPGNVTVFGESAGAASIAAHLAAGRVGTLFKRAILQSGAHNLSQAVSTAESAMNKVEAELATRGQTLDNLRAMSTTELIDVQMAALPRSAGVPFGPVRDGQLVPVDLPAAFADGAARHVGILNGTNRDEMGFFWGRDPAFDTLDDDDLVAVVRRLDPRGQHAIAAYRAARTTRGDSTDNRSIAVAIASDLTFRNATIELAELQSAQAAAHMYRFDWGSPLYGGLIGACHVLELPFVFGTHRHPANRAFVGESDLNAADRLSDAMQNAWVGFARTGDPGWPAYEMHDRTTQIFDRVTSVELDPAADERRFWSVVD